ncbi:MAG TPA: hypothetical protein VK824_03510 [Planctomycetota bacterium]|nr:hypothetical protein [Planctomycetota bacterium]
MERHDLTALRETSSAAGSPASGSRPGAVAACLVVLAALCAYGWTLRGPVFELDDYSYVGCAAAPAREVFGLDRPELAGQEPDGGGSAFLFRPLTWLSLRLEVAISGAPLSPLVFHAGSLVLHALAALLVLLLLSVWMSRPAAFLGALIFAVHPGGGQAVLWVAARGDLLMTVCALAALLAAARPGAGRGWLRALAAGAALALSVLSKNQALSFVPIVLLLLAWSERGRGPAGAVMRSGLALLPVAVAWLWQAWVTGGFRPTYVGGQTFTPAMLPEMLARWPSLLVQLLVPWCTETGTGSYAPRLAGLLATLELPRAALVAPLLALPAAALLVSPGRFGWRALAAVSALALVTFPPLLVWNERMSFGWSRVLYPAMVPLAALFGLALDALRARPAPASRAGRVAAWALACAVALMTADTLVHLARTEGHARELVRGRLAAVEKVLADGPPAVLVAVIDPGAEFAGLPLLASFVGSAMSPPFRSELAPVVHAWSEPVLMESGLLASHPGPVRVLALEDETLRPVGPPLPRLPDPLPELVPAPGSGGLRWAPAGAVPPRAVGCIVFVVPPGPARRWEAAARSDRVRRSWVLDLPAGDAPREVPVSLEGDFQWAVGARLLAVTLVPADGGPVAGGAPLGPPRLLARPPAVEAVLPAENAQAGFDSRPAFALRGVPPGMPLRLEFSIGSYQPAVSFDYLIAPQDVRLGADGLAHFDLPAREPDHADLPSVRWDNLSALYERHFAKRAMPSLDVHWRVAVLLPDGATMIGRSAYRVLSLR